MNVFITILAARMRYACDGTPHPHAKTIQSRCVVCVRGGEVGVHHNLLSAFLTTTLWRISSSLLIGVGIK